MAGRGARDGRGAGWDEGDLDSVSLDEAFVRGATIREAEIHRLPRRRRRRRVRRGRRRPQASTVVLVLVIGTLVGLVAAGVSGVGPTAWLAGSLGIGEDAEDVLDGAESAAATSSTIALDLATTTTAHGLEGGAYRRGDCIIWNEAIRVQTDAPVRTVPCTEPHFFEVTGSSELPGAMNYPESEATWEVVSVERCAPFTKEHLGYPLVSTGRFWTAMIRPSKEGWRSGDRTIHCGIEAFPEAWAPADGPDASEAWDEPVAFTGKVKGQPQERVPPAGTCYGDAPDGSGAVVVACAGPHEFEVSGHVGLEGRFDHAPSDDELDGRVDADCRGVAARYLGRPLRRNESASSMPISAEEWAAGWRTLPCIVGRTAGTDWATVSGSLAAS